MSARWFCFRLFQLVWNLSCKRINWRLLGKQLSIDALYVPLMGKRQYLLRYVSKSKPTSFLISVLFSVFIWFLEFKPYSVRIFKHNLVLKWFKKLILDWFIWFYLMGINLNTDLCQDHTPSNLSCISSFEDYPFSFTFRLDNRVGNVIFEQGVSLLWNLFNPL